MVRTLIFGLVIVAGLIRDPVSVGIGPHAHVIPTLTTPGLPTVDDVLHGEVGGGPGTFPFDVDSVCHSTGGAHSPTGTTIW